MKIVLIIDNVTIEATTVEQATRLYNYLKTYEPKAEKPKRRIKSKELKEACAHCGAIKQPQFEYFNGKVTK